MTLQIQVNNFDPIRFPSALGSLSGPSKTSLWSGADHYQSRSPPLATGTRIWSCYGAEKEGRRASVKQEFNNSITCLWVFSERQQVKNRRDGFILIILRLISSCELVPESSREASHPPFHPLYFTFFHTGRSLLHGSSLSTLALWVPPEQPEWDFVQSKMLLL